MKFHILEHSAFRVRPALMKFSGLRAWQLRQRWQRRLISPEPRSERAFPHRWKRRLRTVSTKAGLTGSQFSLSAIWYDYNNDGHPDLFGGNYLKYDKSKDGSFGPATGHPGPLNYAGQPNLLYRNNGDGTFTDVTRKMGLWKPDGRSMGVIEARPLQCTGRFISNRIALSFQFTTTKSTLPSLF